MTVCTRTTDVLAAKLLLPLYLTVMEFVPTPRANAEVVYLALPRVKWAVCRTVVPSKNVTVPVGLPEPFTTDVMVAVKVTLCPYTEGLGFEVTVLVVAPTFQVKFWLARPLAVASSNRDGIGAGAAEILPLIRPERVLIDRPDGRPAAE